MISLIAYEFPKELRSIVDSEIYVKDTFEDRNHEFLNDNRHNRNATGFIFSYLFNGPEKF